MVFKKRLIPEGSIFEEMQEIRKKQKISLGTISKETKIPTKYLKALEEGSLEKLPDVLYIKNIIKKYLSFFNIDPKPFIAKLDLSQRAKQYSQKTPNLKSMIVLPRIIKMSIAIFLVLILIVYLGFSISKIFRPPSIIIYSPKEGAVVESSIVIIKGKTEQGTGVFINNEQVVLDKNGGFNKELNLQKGLNLIKISGINRYSKENVIWRNVILNIK